MNISLDISWKSLNKRGEELCGDTVEMIKTMDSDIIILSDGMGSGVKASILSTLTSKILGTMLKNGETIEDCVETIAMTLPVCSTRQVAYSTFSILQIFNDGNAYLVEYDNPGCIMLREGKLRDLPFGVKEIEGKVIREYRFTVKKDDYFILMSDGVIHAGVGKTFSFGWTRDMVAEFIEKQCTPLISGPRLTALICKVADDLYRHSPGDDTTVIVARIVDKQIVNICTGPPKSKADDQRMMKDFMSNDGLKVICGGTSANIASRYLGRSVKVSLQYSESDPSIPPIASIEGIDLVTEGVLTLNKAIDILHQYNYDNDNDDSFFQVLDADNGAAMLAKLIVEHATHVNLFVGEAINSAHQAIALPFDLSIRMRLIDRLIKEVETMGKTVAVKYY